MNEKFTIRIAGSEDVDVIARALLEAANWNGEARKSLRDMYSSHYLRGWPQDGDAGVVAESKDGTSAGAAWFRQLKGEDAGYGYVADDIPELSIGVLPEHRGQGAGAGLMEGLIDQGRKLGLRAISLSVEDGNRARHLYERYGFEKVGRNGGSDTLLLNLGV